MNNSPLAMAGVLASLGSVFACLPEVADSTDQSPRDNRSSAAVPYGPDTRHLVFMFDGTVCGDGFSRERAQLFAESRDPFVRLSSVLWQEKTLFTEVRDLGIAALDDAEVPVEYFHGPDLRMNIFPEPPRLQQGYEQLCEMIRDGGKPTVVHLFGFSRGAIAAIAIQKKLQSERCGISSESFDPTAGLLFLIEPVEYILSPDNVHWGVAGIKALLLAPAILNINLKPLQPLIESLLSRYPSAVGAWHMGDMSGWDMGDSSDGVISEATVNKELLYVLGGSAADDLVFAPLRVDNDTEHRYELSLPTLNHLQIGGGFDVHSVFDADNIREWIEDLKSYYSGSSGGIEGRIFPEVAEQVVRMVVKAGNAAMADAREETICTVVPQVLGAAGLHLAKRPSYCAGPALRSSWETCQEHEECESKRCGCSGEAVKRCLPDTTNEDGEYVSPITECSSSACTSDRSCKDCGVEICQADGTYGTCEGKTDETQECKDCGVLICQADGTWSSCTGRGEDCQPDGTWRREPEPAPPPNQPQPPGNSFTSYNTIVLRIRRSPNLSAEVLDYIQPSTCVTKVATAGNADGYAWWQVLYNGTSGYAASGPDSSPDAWLNETTPCTP